ncbi:FecR domain-containing protein [Pseudomonas sp. 2835]|uniref:FecR domain-containing protein n=1 Tax=Pseudomonas sp. 2835 TaxID=3156451 RepID=UPI003D2301B2
MNRPSDAPIDAAIVEQASHWLMLHWDGPLDSQQRLAFAHWQAADPEHQRAWQRLQTLQQTLAAVPAQTARSVLDERQSRRTLFRQLCVLLLVGGTGYLGQQHLPWREAMADQRTAPGEVRRLQLADGSQLLLNSRTSVNIRFSTQERRIRLLEGELLLTSGNDPRPLKVETAAGEVQALGTRFAVRELRSGSRVELFEGALMIRPGAGQEQLLKAGHGLWFNRQGGGPQHAADSNSIAWEHGRLIAERQPLGRFLEELGRHRRGVIRCEPAIAELPITGVFALADSERTLAALQDSLPIRVHYLSRYWVTVTAR